MGRAILVLGALLLAALFLYLIKNPPKFETPLARACLFTIQGFLLVFITLLGALGVYGLVQLFPQ